MLKFLRDLALLTGIWRHACATERSRRHELRPEPIAQREDEVLERCRRDGVGEATLQHMRETAPSGRWLVRDVENAYRRHG